jgi:hypothetical protein
LGVALSRGETTERDGFLITTVFCLNVLFVWQKEGIPIEKHILRKAINWCFSLVNIDGTGRWVFFIQKKEKEYLQCNFIACGVLVNFQDLLSLRRRKGLTVLFYIFSLSKKEDIGTTPRVKLMLIYFINVIHVRVFWTMGR